MTDQAAASVPSAATEEGALSRQIDEILSTHHAFLRRVLPEIGVRLGAVTEAHGAEFPELMPLRMIFTDFRTELETHLIREEQILFGQIRTVDTSRSLQRTQRESLRNALRSMAAEHEASLAELEAMRRLTRGFVAPEGAADDLSALYDLFRDLLADLREHHRRENQVLFPALEDLLDAA